MTQYACCNDAFSVPLAVHSEVPQGSVFGPLLFLEYVNGIEIYMPPAVWVRLFADDCMMFFKGCAIELNIH